MATSQSPTRRCPRCGAENSGLSAYCAECGVELNGSGNGSWNDGDRTESFRPAHAFAAWSTPAENDSPSRTTSGTHTAVGTPPPYATFGNHAVTMIAPAPRGKRGFWLGLVAWLLILAVLGVYIWSAVLGEGLRDDIRDIVPGLSAITWPGP